jgi:hypothetical protein
MVPIPASAAAVAAACDAMNDKLGSQSLPGPYNYVLGSLNSNSAASAVANQAIQAEQPGAPIFGPPPNAAAVAWPNMLLPRRLGR